jgi:hypothetical protein
MEDGSGLADKPPGMIGETTGCLFWLDMHPICVYGDVEPADAIDPPAL